MSSCLFGDHGWDEKMANLIYFFLIKKCLQPQYSWQCNHSTIDDATTVKLYPVKDQKIFLNKQICLVFYFRLNFRCGILNIHDMWSIIFSFMLHAPHHLRLLPRLLCSSSDSSACNTIMVARIWVFLLILRKAGCKSWPPSPTIIIMWRGVPTTHSMSQESWAKILFFCIFCLLYFIWVGHTAWAPKGHEGQSQEAQSSDL